MLKQAAHTYTPVVFEIFRKEFELFMDSVLFSCGEAGATSEYKVAPSEKPKEHFVRFDSSDCSCICTCRKFEFMGIPCCHMLKVLDYRNIKELPQRYLLKRWRRTAKSANEENQGYVANGNGSSLNSIVPPANHHGLQGFSAMIQDTPVSNMHENSFRRSSWCRWLESKHYSFCTVPAPRYWRWSSENRPCGAPPNKSFQLVNYAAVGNPSYWGAHPT